MKRKSLAFFLAISMVLGNTTGVLAANTEEIEIEISSEETVSDEQTDLSGDEILITDEEDAAVEGSNSEEDYAATDVTGDFDDIITIELEDEGSEASSDGASTKSSSESEFASNGEQSGNMYEKELPPLTYQDVDAEKDIENPDVTQMASFQSNSDYAASKYVTPNLPLLRDQNPYGSCWAHASIALAEINLITKGIETSDIDFSELHLSYFTYNSVVDPLGGTEGDKNRMSFTGMSESARENAFLDRGGNLTFAQNVLASWMGAADEATAPYDSAGTVLDRYNSTGKGLDDSIAFEDAFHMVGYADATMPNYLSSSNEVNPNFKDQFAAVKKLIVDYGAIGISFNASTAYTISGSATKYTYNSDNNAFYFPDKSRTNHAVTIVGWDDNFSKDKFNITPPGNGAWLVRNSWHKEGEDQWLDDYYRESYYGYFWMSYYDGSLSPAAYAFDFEPASNYDHNYQYDGAMDTIFYSVDKAANVFTVHGGNGAQALKAVSFVTGKTDLNYTIDVYKDLTNDSDPTSGKLVATKKGTTTYEGYYTVPLDKAIVMDEGTKFSVVVTPRDQAGNNGMLAREYGYFNDSYWYQVTAAAKPGQSFYTYGYGWMDAASNGYSSSGNFRIKAFTVDTEATNNSYTITYVVNKGQNDPQNPATYVAGTAKTFKAAIPPTGYTFSGWYTDSAFTTKKDGIVKTDRSNITVYAKFTPIQYTIKFNANGGTGTMSSVKVKYNAKKTLPANAFTYSGYVFTGWNTKKDGSGKTYADKAAVKNLLKKAGTVTLYATWAKKYSVKYVLNGGTNDPSNPTSYIKGTEKTFLSPTAPKGYVFDSWYTDSEFKTKKTGIVSTDAKNLTLYAKFNPIKYKVAFYSNGGSGTMKTMSCSYGKTYKLTTNAFTPAKGYVFNGWNSKSDGSGKAFANAAQIKNLTATNGKTVKLYAQWKEITYKITLNPNGGKVSNAELILTKTYENLPTPTKKGYKFAGWYSAKSGGTKVANGSKLLSAKDHTIYARWKAISYTVQFNANGGSGSMSAVKATYGKTFTLTSNAFKAPTGYKFSSWNTKKDGSGTKYTNNSSVKNLSSKSGAKVTLYAQWEPLSYKVTFNSNGGSSVKAQTVKYDTVNKKFGVAKKPANPTKKGYTFAGWYSDKAFTSKYSFSKQVTKKITLYAKWTKNS